MSAIIHSLRVLPRVKKYFSCLEHFGIISRYDYVEYKLWIDICRSKRPLLQRTFLGFTYFKIFRYSFQFYEIEIVIL